ncbi:hypothetical protein C6495_14870 [Candidatus Poribacteria bacterium]|nr:MAG: hypothetical protein C6495_14870 [Candidatus Poribacteria bacterium]
MIIDKTGKIVKIDTEVNAGTHGADLVDFFEKTLETPSN